MSLVAPRIHWDARTDWDWIMNSAYFLAASRWYRSSSLKLEPLSQPAAVVESVWARMHDSGSRSPRM